MRYLRAILRHLGPAIARPPLGESLRAAIGATMALVLCAAFMAVITPATGANTAYTLIAPLGATTFLLFAVPNSPLAQPWPAIIGNSLSALVAWLVLLLPLPVPVAAGMAVGVAILAMAIARALHPPGAAVALLAVLTAPATLAQGASFALMPVGLETALLVLGAVLWSRATGGRYPFRLHGDAGPHATTDTAPDQRPQSPAALQAVLSQMHLDANIGVEDLSRLIAATSDGPANVQAITAADIMSRDLITLPAHATPAMAAEKFLHHAIKTLPVIDADGALLALITPTDLLRSMIARSGPARFWHKRTKPLLQLAQGTTQAIAPDTRIGDLIHLLQDGKMQAAPVVAQGRLVGLVSRSDLLGCLART